MRHQDHVRSFRAPQWHMSHPTLPHSKMSLLHRPVCSRPDHCTPSVHEVRSMALNRHRHTLWHSCKRPTQAPTPRTIHPKRNRGRSSQCPRQSPPHSRLRHGTWASRSARGSNRLLPHHRIQRLRRSSPCPSVPSRRRHRPTRCHSNRGPCGTPRRNTGHRCSLAQDDRGNTGHSAAIRSPMYTAAPRSAHRSRPSLSSSNTGPPHIPSNSNTGRRNRVCRAARGSHHCTSYRNLAIHSTSLVQAKHSPDPIRSCSTVHR